MKPSHFIDEELQEVLASIDMQAWLDREGVRYKEARGSSGRQLNVKECPCCGNSNWKVYLNAETGLGNCFSGDCEKKFNRWTFISSSLGITHRETIEHVKAVAREQGWRPPLQKRVETNIKGELTLPASISLPHKGRNMKYLENRGITANIAQYFDLKLSLIGKFLYKDDDGRMKSQDYRNRIIIPIFDLEGNLVSFQGRDITGTSDRKYLFPPGYSSTGTLLLNGHNAVGARHILICEGAFDVFAAKIALDGELALREIVPVGSFGKHLSSGDSNSQLAKLIKLKELGLECVTFMWDAEQAALTAAVDAALKVKSCGLKVRIAVLPEGKDPNEVPAEEVRRAFWKAVTVDMASATKLKMMANAMRK